jgi:hypothetical protein
MMDDSELARLTRAYIEATKRLTKSEHPYVADLIDVLRRHPKGRLRRTVIELPWRQREPLGLQMPRTFIETVQNAYNRHADGYAGFLDNREPREKPLFFSGGKNSGFWAVDEKAATAWLVAKFPSHPNLL